MSKGITHSCANIWRAIARAGGWISAQRAAKDWAGIYELDEITDHLKVLQRGGFLETKPTHRDGAVYAYTVKCHPLPGETLVSVTPTADAPAAAGQVATPRQNDLMKSFYSPAPCGSERKGAMDYKAVPSLHMGHRRAFRSDAA